MTTSAMDPPPPRSPSNDSEPEPITTSISQSDESSTLAEVSSMNPPPPKNPNQSDLETREVVETKVIEESKDDSVSVDGIKPPRARSVKQNPVPYTIPEWSGPPCHKLQLEILKEGAIIDQLDVHEKGAYLFGRDSICDFSLEHPSISRFHAVIRYKRSGVAYLFDLGSTHGTSINKKKVDKKVFVDLHVGDVIRFGCSTRLYIFQGPSELMPPEKDLQLYREAKMRMEMSEREASLRRARQQASMADGVSWGMGEDAIEEEEDDVEEITWQTYTGELTPKQEKTKEKVLKRLEKLLEELENLEETLNDSIRESLGAKTGRKPHGKKKGMVEDEEDLSSDEDDFYDRTKKKPSTQKGSENQTVETVDSLLDKRDNVLKEIVEKNEQILAEKNKMETENVTDVASRDSLDALDAYMTGLSTALVQDKTAQFQQELSGLQSELSRILYLLKIADPTGEEVKKRELKSEEPKIKKFETPPVEMKISLPLKRADPNEQKEKEVAKGLVDSDNKPEVEKKASETVEEKKSTVFVPSKPQWLGSAANKATVEEKKPEIVAAVTDTTEDIDGFVGYKDRNYVLQTTTGVESRTGLIIRKRKREDKSEEEQDAVALLLKHSVGHHVNEEEEEISKKKEDKQGSGQSRKKKKKTAKKVVGPDKPEYLNDEDEESDEEEEDHSQICTVGKRFACDELYLSDESDDEFDYEPEYMMNKMGLAESALYEVINDHQTEIKDDIRNQVSAVETEIMNEIETSRSTIARVEKYSETRKEVERKLDLQYQRKVDEALDTHLTAVQREHEIKSQIVERKLRSEEAQEEARRREKALQEEKIHQEKAQAQAEMLAKIRAEEAKKEVERKAAKEVAKKELADRKAAEQKLAEEKAVIERVSVATSNAQAGGKSIQAAESALTLEKHKLKKLEELGAMNESLKSRSNEDFSSFEKHIGRVIKQITGVKDNVSTKINDIVKIFKDPRCPVSISIATFAKKMVSSKQNPFACSYVIVYVTSQFPQAMDILLAEFHKACIYTVPKHIVNSQSAWDSDEYERLDSIMRLYGALVQTDIRGGNATNIHGIEHGWAWLARFLNKISANNRATATALNAFLQTAGFGLHQRYKSQFVKVVNVVREHFLQKLKAKKDLQLIIADMTAYLDDRKYLKEPEGRSLQTTSLLSAEFTAEIDQQNNNQHYQRNNYYRDYY